MISLILKEGGFDPTMLVGGVLDAMGSNAHLGHGKYLVFEACEAYNSIDYFLPEISVLLNIDKDHMECYNNFDELKGTFSRFLNKVPFYSFCVVNIDDDNIKDIVPSLTKRVVTFGFSNEADFRAANIEYNGINTSFDVICNNENIGKFTLNIPGTHNVLNALASIATAVHVGVAPEFIKSALLKFKNSDRRFQILLEKEGLSVVDDYAHHPKEIEATLGASRQYMKGRKLENLVAIFQPHLFSRTKLHYEEFAKSLLLADKIYLTSIYPAREKPIPGVTSNLIYDLMKENKTCDVVYIEDLNDLVKEVVKNKKEGDFIITLGAGSITASAHKIAGLL
jgi:UDP-N-acetylmuramate--alanine ligase